MLANLRRIPQIVIYFHLLLCKIMIIRCFFKFVLRYTQCFSRVLSNNCIKKGWRELLAPTFISQFSLTNIAISQSNNAQYCQRYDKQEQNISFLIYQHNFYLISFFKTNLLTKNRHIKRGAKVIVSGIYSKNKPYIFTTNHHFIDLYQRYN